MPNIRAITTIINTSLKDNLFNTRRFQDAKYFDLAYLISNTNEEKKTVSAMKVDDAGQGVDVTIDDNVPIQVYHRNTNITFTDDEKESFGDPANNVTEVDEMVLICIGDRKKLKVNQEDIASALWLYIPRNLTVSQLLAINTQKVIIEPLEVNVKPEEVWNQEYENVEYALAPEYFMLSMKYKITSVYTKCFSLCN